MLLELFKSYFDTLSDLFVYYGKHLLAHLHTSNVTLSMRF